MLASYDFDIHWIIPREMEDDPRIAKMLSDIGFDGSARGNYVALFRDPQVIASIERADPVLRDYLKASGFGFVPHKGRSPAGLYPAEDEAARRDVVEKLTANLPDFDLVEADLGGFDVAAFRSAIANARPLPPDKTVRPASPGAKSKHSPEKGAADGGPVAADRHGRIGTLLMNLVGLILLVFIVWKLFASRVAL